MSDPAPTIPAIPARRVQLEQQQGQADHEQQVRHRRAGHGVHELPDQAQAAELHLLAVGDLAIAVGHLGLDTGKLDDELTDHRRIGVDEAEVDGPPGAHRSPTSTVAGSPGATQASSRLGVTSMLEPGAMPVTSATATRRTDSPAALLPEARSRRRPGPTNLRWWRPGRRAPRRDDRAAAVELQHQRHRAGPLRGTDLVVDEVDEHGVEEAVHLHDRHGAGAALGAVRLCCGIDSRSGRIGRSAAP